MPAEDGFVRAYLEADARAYREDTDFVEAEERLTAEQRRRMDEARWGRAVGLACTLEAPGAASALVVGELRARVMSSAEWLYGVLRTLPTDQPTPMQPPPPGPAPVPMPDETVGWVWSCSVCNESAVRINALQHRKGCTRPGNTHVWFHAPMQDPAGEPLPEADLLACGRCGDLGGNHKYGCPNGAAGGRVYNPPGTPGVATIQYGQDYRCPECRAGKHQNCPGQSANEADELTACPCWCATPHTVS